MNSATSWLASLSKPRSSPLDRVGSPHSHRKPNTASPTSSVIKVVINKSPPPLTHPIPVTDGINMDPQQRESRGKPRISYEISSDSDQSGSHSEIDSPYASPTKQLRTSEGVEEIEDEDEEDLEEMEPGHTPLPRGSSAGHSLRQRNVLNQSLRAKENGDQPRRVKKRKVARPNPKSRSKSGKHASSAQVTERSEIRHQIATVTAAKRASFFVANKEIFIPLLPENNYIQRLVDQYQGPPNSDPSVPYEALSKQPTGFRAITCDHRLFSG